MLWTPMLMIYWQSNFDSASHSHQFSRLCKSERIELSIHFNIEFYQGVFYCQKIAMHPQSKSSYWAGLVFLHVYDYPSCYYVV